MAQGIRRRRRNDMLSKKSFMPVLALLSCVLFGVLTLETTNRIIERPRKSKEEIGEWCSVIFIDAPALVEKNGQAEDCGKGVEAPKWLAKLWNILAERNIRRRGPIAIELFCGLEKTESGNQMYYLPQVDADFKQIRRLNTKFLTEDKRQGEAEGDENGEICEGDKGVEIREIESRIIHNFGKIGEIARAKAESGIVIERRKDFVIAALDRALQIVNDCKEEKESNCRQWDIFICPDGREYDWNERNINIIRNRTMRFCPKNTKINLVSENSLDEMPEIWRRNVLSAGEARGESKQEILNIVNRRIEVFKRFIHSSAHVSWINLEEYEDYNNVKRHLIYVDISGSARTGSDAVDPITWFDRYFSDEILPSFLSTVKYYPGQTYELFIFGDITRKLSEGSVEDVVVSQRMTKDDLEGIGHRNTTLLNAILSIKAAGPSDSVWIYTDALDAPGEGKKALEKWWKTRGKNDCLNPIDRTGKLFLHLPITVSRNDASVKLFIEIVEDCLHFDAEIAPAPPARESLEQCEVR
jgi:hypothetical protein